MAPISKIEVEIKTGDVANAGTDGHVYLGICGREFYLDRGNVNDFEKGHTDTFILGGNAANILNKGENDPRKPQLDTENLPNNVGVDGFPVYIRFEPRGGNPDWNLETVSVRVFVGNNRHYLD